MNDSQVQSRCKPGVRLDRMFTTALVRGAAKLEMRQHAGALECFAEAERDAASFPGFYAGKLKVRLSSEDQQWIEELTRRCSRIGTAITFRDMGRMDEAKPAFQVLADAERDTMLKADLAALAREST